MTQYIFPFESELEKYFESGCSFVASLYPTVSGKLALYGCMLHFPNICTVMNSQHASVSFDF
jgi:hypothetical protein